MKMQTHFREWPLALGLSMFFLLFATFARAQTAPTQTPRPSDNNERSHQGRDITDRELASFDQFLDSQREIAEQVRKNPALVVSLQCRVVLQKLLVVVTNRLVLVVSHGNWRELGLPGPG